MEYKFGLSIADKDYNNRILVHVVGDGIYYVHITPGGAMNLSEDEYTRGDIAPWILGEEKSLAVERLL